MKKNEVSVFLDSGAFSAFTKNVTIDIQEYIKFIKEHRESITVYSNLDVIGDAEASLRNQEIMEDAGLSPIPCFHRGEDWKYLEHYVEEYNYIALGGVAQGKDKGQLISWFNECWDIICDQPDRMPRTKVHGFAVTALDHMFRYPWFSVDSTSWVLTGRFGSIFVPSFRDGKYIYDKDTWKIVVSNRSPGQKDDDSLHFNRLGRSGQKIVLDYIESKGYKLGRSEFRKEKKATYKLKEGERWTNVEDAGLLRGMIDNYGVFVKPEILVQPEFVEVIIERGVSNDYKIRDAMNIQYFLDLEKNFKKWPWPYERKGVTPFFRSGGK